MKTNPIVLIHGLWMTPRSWDYFREFYEDRGYEVLAPAWPCIEGELAVRHDPSPLRGLGIAEIANHYAEIVQSLDEPPILIGHSFGGLIVQLLIDRGLGAAAVAIDGVAPKGVWQLPFSALKSASAVLMNPFNYGRVVKLGLDQFRYAFANTMTDAEVEKAYEEYAIAGPGRPVFEQALANFNPWAPNQVNRANSDRAPLLLIAGSEDHQVPAVQVRANYEKYGRSLAVTEYKEFPNRSHLLIAQQGWQEVADYALTWVESKLGTGVSSRVRVHAR